MLPEARDRSALLDMLIQYTGISASVEGKSFAAYCADDNLGHGLRDTHTVYAMYFNNYTAFLDTCGRAVLLLSVG